MKDCVLFSSWIRKPSLDLGVYYLDIIKKYHSDSDLIVGLNKGCCNQWVRELEQRKITYRRHKGKSINSDAAGFMAALAELRSRKNSYRTIWFAHSKGASYKSFNASESFRTGLEKDFWSKKAAIDAAFDKDPTLGLAANIYLPQGNQNTDHVLNSLHEFPCATAPVFVAHTFYVTDFASIRAFLDTSREKFFTMDFLKKMHDGRYFFEAYFCMVPVKMGKRYAAIQDLPDPSGASQH